MPMVIPTPNAAIAKVRPATSAARANSTSADAKIRLETSKTTLPPLRSIQRPAAGERIGETASDADVSAKMRVGARPRSRAIGSPSAPIR
jgi:hypothetical protein